MSLQTIRGGASVTSIPEQSVLQMLTDLVKASGILDITGTMFKCTPGSGLQILINVGRAYLLASGGNAYPVINTVSTGVTISANASGNPRYTTLVLYQDMGASANADASNISKFLAVDGTPAASPTIPSDATIQSAVGGSNPFVRLSDVIVVSGASSFIQNDITDRRTQALFRSDILNQDNWVPVAATGATTTLDCSLGKKFRVTLGATTTLALLNLPLMPKTIEVAIVNDGIHGLTWWSNLKWPDNVVPTLTMVNTKVDKFVIDFITVTSDSVNTSEGAVVGQNI